MGGLDLLELDDKVGLAPWIAIGVVLQSQSAERFTDLVLARIRRHLQVSIVVACRVGFDHDACCVCLVPGAGEG